MGAPGLTILAGPSFAGKTTYARAADAPHIDQDTIRDELTGGRRWEAGIEDAREPFRRQVLTALSEHGSAVVEWIWPYATERAWLRGLAAEAGVSVHLVIFDNVAEQAERRAEAVQRGYVGGTEPDRARVERTQGVFDRWPEYREHLRGEQHLYATVRWIEKTTPLRIERRR